MTSCGLASWGALLANRRLVCHQQWGCQVSERPAYAIVTAPMAQQLLLLGAYLTHHTLNHLCCCCPCVCMCLQRLHALFASCRLQSHFMPQQLWHGQPACSLTWSLSHRI
jgi:hypothetical protein